MSEMEPQQIQNEMAETRTLYEQVRAAIMQKAGESFDSDFQKLREEGIKTKGEEKTLPELERYLEDKLAELKGKEAVFAHRDQVEKGKLSI